MQDKNAPATRRIDLSKCKLLSTYGRSLADSKEDGVKVGAPVKTGVLTKYGILTKIGAGIKVGLSKRR
jgi:hypothetical protein